MSLQKWPCKGIRGHGNELCASPERGVKRGNFWNDGCRRWCPICFSSLEFTASAALCKQLGSKSGCSTISSSPFHFFPLSFFFFFMLGRQCPWENIILDFSGEILNYSALSIVWMPILQFLLVHLSPVTEQNCGAKCLRGGHCCRYKRAGVKNTAVSRCLMDSCGYDNRNSLLSWWKTIIVNLFYDVCRLKEFFES